MASADERTETGTPAVPTAVMNRSGRFNDLQGVVKFAATAAVLAMLGDAVVPHAILWQNDPYWTYWVTDTFLITTIFGVGTALLGVGLGRGALLTAVQTLVLTTYYWSLSPIGLPAHAEWLDLKHTWVTGVPVHFAVYYLGYVTALWLWRRHRPTTPELPGRLGADAGSALAVGTAIVVVVGGLHTVLLADFPGVTWFVMRLVVLVPFIMAWWSLAGRDLSAAVGGGIVAGVLLAAYTHYLGPSGLPASDLRVIAQDPPPTPVHWLSYREEFLVVFPITVLVAVAALVAVSLWRGHRWAALGISRRAAFVAGVSTIALVAGGAAAAGSTSTADERATITAAGQARVEDGPPYRGELIATTADLRLEAESRNTKQTPQPPHDQITVQASVTHPAGTRYEVSATDAMVADPLGRSSTWAGVGYDRWHHGRSGSGTSLLPPTRSEVATYGLGEVRADGQLIATGVPVHAMTVADGSVELHVGDPNSPVAGLPDGHLRVVWEEADAATPDGPELARNLLGGGLLIALLALAVAAARSQERSFR